MAEKTIKTRIINKHDTAANWEAAVNFCPKKGEIIIYDSDNSHKFPRVKIGDGQTLVNALPFIDNLENGKGNGSLQQLSFTRSNGKQVVMGAIASGDGAAAFGGKRFDKLGTSDTDYPPTEAAGIQSFATGGGTVAHGAFTFTANKDTDAFQKASAAFCGGTKAGRTQEEFNLKYPSGRDEEGKTYEDSYSFAFAEGESTSASGRASHAQGKGTSANGIAAFAGGRDTIAEAANSTALGLNCQTHAPQSFATGYLSKCHSTAENAIAVGQENNAIARASAAFNYQTTASGEGAMATGYNTKASGFAQLVTGQFNAEDTDNTYRFIVGNGDSDGNRKNAFAVAQSGDAYVQGSLSINNDQKVATENFVTTMIDTKANEANIQNGSGKNSLQQKGCLAKGENSIALGIGGEFPYRPDGAAEVTKTSEAVGPYSTVEGHYNIATKDAEGSHAEGHKTIVSGKYSHVEGDYSKVSGFAAHAEGFIAEAKGNYSHAEGNKTKAYGLNSHAEGHVTTASVENAHSEGSLTVAEGLQSHAEGDSTKASNTGSHAEGHSTHTTGKFSHAEGNSTLADGIAAHAEGEGTKAMKYASHAEGNVTETTNDYQHVSGAYNDITDSSGKIFVVGVGKFRSPKNGLTLSYDSTTDLNNGNLEVYGTIAQKEHGSTAKPLATQEFVLHQIPTVAEYESLFAL